jgi:hypothetical protein
MIREFARKYNRSEQALLEHYAAFLEKGFKPEEAIRMMQDELNVLKAAEQAVNSAPKRPATTAILLPVEESKFEEFPEGIHDVVVADIELDEYETGQTDSEGKPLVRQYVRFVFRRPDGTEMSGFANAKISTRSKLYQWITKITGQAPMVGRHYDLKTLVGKKCRVYVKRVVDENGSMYNRIDDVLPAQGVDIKPDAAPTPKSTRLSDYI